MPIPGTVQITGQLAPTSTSDVFATHAAIYSAGGMREVADHATRNAFGTTYPARISLGMLITTQNDNLVWQLNTATPAGTNADWTQFGAGGGTVTLGFVQGRLTLQSGVPVPFTDQIGKTTIYFTPYNGNLWTLFDGTNWTTYAFAEIALALGTLVNNTNYDVYGFENAGVPSLDPPLAWRAGPVAISAATTATPIVITATAHGLSTGDEAYISAVGGINANGTWTVTVTGVNNFSLNTSVGVGIYTSGGRVQGRDGTTKPSLQDGRYCKTGDKTRLFLGTFRTTSATTTEDSGGGVTTQVPGNRLLWNLYNPDLCEMAYFDSTATWSYTSPAYRPFNNVTAAGANFVIGLQGRISKFEVFAACVCGTVSGSAGAGIGLDGLTALAIGNRPVIRQSFTNAGASSVTLQPNASWKSQIVPGVHQSVPLEFGASATTMLWIGAASPAQTGMYVEHYR